MVMSHKYFQNRIVLLYICATAMCQTLFFPVFLEFALSITLKFDFFLSHTTFDNSYYSCDLSGGDNGCKIKSSSCYIIQGHNSM